MAATQQVTDPGGDEHGSQSPPSAPGAATLEGEPIILTELMSTSLRDILTGSNCHLKEQPIGRHVALALNYTCTGWPHTQSTEI